ncbi:helix-turn-helix domain-containing protein (plasmid) [Roseomonas sp. CCTCC AB2023176]|uniref:helix-turn-helix domain-containing protein n=1 Tax=Roseomonas sp. CCTCC AB2023176 TaxID=3342640 RepID=UPI0035D98318
MLHKATTLSVIPAVRADPAPPNGAPRELNWRRPVEPRCEQHRRDPVLASRWLDDDPARRRYAVVNPSDRHVIGVALRRSRVRVTSDSVEIFDGLMGPGTVYVTGPAETVEAEVQGPCDFIHLYVANDHVDRIETSGGEGRFSSAVLRDDVAGHLARSLAEEAHGCDPNYAESVARTVLLRVALLSNPANGVGALPKWRLRRVQEHIEASLDGPITLADLAGVAGLSRSYFAAQFRVATGSRPHDYVAEQRIERAKSMLADGETAIVQIALAVGFQTQAHFSTVFKKQTGTSPARWRVAQRDHR